MSYDELPPGSKPASAEGEAASPGSEASAQDAPPAARTRRRRAAAAEPPTTAPSPPPPSARKPRTRRQAVSVEPSTDSPASAEPDAPAPQIAAEEEPAPRRRRTAAARSAPAEGEPPAPEAAPEPAPRARRTRKPAESPAAPPSEPELAETVSPAEERPARRRSRRGTGRPPAEAEAAAPSTEPAEPGEEISGEEQPPTETRTRRGRRGGRSRRKPGAAGAAGAGEAAPPGELETLVDLSIGAHLVMRAGLPEISIYGTIYPPVLFFGNMESPRNRQRVLSEVRRAAAAGVHLHSTLIELPCPLTDASEALDEVDTRVRAILDADPDGYLMPRVVFVPARGWRREYPMEIATYANGTVGDPSITSERFWKEAERSLEALAFHFGQAEWGKRIFAYHMERGEWFQPADLGFDRSVANRDAFRDWLREKYESDLVGLRASWYDSDVQFHTAEIPPLPSRLDATRAFYESRRERRYIDFNEFTSETTAQRLIDLARAIKRATANNALVSVCYGYTLEFAHPFNGHLALGLLQSSAAVDLICGPPSYRDRLPGGAAAAPAPVDSPPLHGKLWLSEDDTKTFLAPAQQDPDDFNPRLPDRSATEQAQCRAAGRALAQATGIGWMDLWGEGWLDDDSTWNRIDDFTQWYSAFLRHRQHARIPQVVALIDELSLLHIQRGDAFYRRLTAGYRDALQRAGISYGLYLQSDVLSDSFPLDGRLYLFLTPFRLDYEVRAAIKEKLQGGGRTLAWIFAPNSCEERPSIGGAMEEVATGTVGIALRQQEWNSEVGSRVAEPFHPITERLGGKEIGARERLNPSFYVADPEATILAEYLGSGQGSLAVRDLGTWKSVFLGDPVLPVELLRGICRYAGAHVWTSQGDDVTFIGNGWVTVHAARDGHRVIHLPSPAAVYDVSERRLVADEAREHRFFQRGGTTRILCVASTEEFLQRGLPNVTLPGRERQRIVLKPQPEPQRAGEPSLSEDIATLEELLRADISVLDKDLEADVELAATDGAILAAAAESEVAVLAPAPAAGEEGESAEARTGRRRRRRGGRGRGRNRHPAGAEAGPPATESGEAANGVESDGDAE